ncbi:hypothetical protein [Ehrlichia canis]|uniref:hypothetical protein n=1 Tax=Ehrlichia canis TaxID=944 RepID=UPI0005C53F41|nr:hypothetical protein [Ehrlichia canis]AUO54937.1 hypothetical protein C1I72_03590 [Ehrlichia canis]UKC53859.1 hypothetical protein s20019040002_000904 [Ehrlichia canis]UKC54795.1 hypothetical protein s20026770001_000903 [Ehrlichia canis]UKC55731.1 hypothetical protein s21009500007_000903 [Ehrlichia canis]
MSNSQVCYNIYNVSKKLSISSLVHYYCHAIEVLFFEFDRYITVRLFSVILCIICALSNMNLHDRGFVEI